MNSMTPTAPPFLREGGEMGLLLRQLDWSSTDLGEPATWPQSLKTILSLLLNSRFPMFLFWGPQHLCFYNDAYRPSLGNQGKHPNALAQPGAQVWPETWPIIQPLIEQVLAGGEATWNEDQLIPIFRNGRLENVYWTFSYSPVYGDDDQIAGVFVTCTETTQAIEDRQRLRLSEQRFSRLIEQAPVAVALFSGPRFVISLANERVLEYWGRTRQQVINKPLFDALPEAAGQGYEALLLGVYTSGERFVAKELTVTLARKGQLEPTYIDFVYEPFYENDGQITGVMVICTEITEQVLARQAVEATQLDLQQTTLRLSMALEAGRLGSYELDLTTGLMQCTPQCKANYGLGPEATFNYTDLLAVIVADDRPRVEQAVVQAIATQQTYRAEYRVRWPDQSLHWIQASGLPMYGPDGRPALITGTTLEITAQRMARQELERQVRERTAQLQTSVAELRRSNDNLGQFAYVASHDLQEPLRKIQSFGDILKTQYAGELGGGVHYLERMQWAAGRMSTLIRDLLVYSRISIKQEVSTRVSLQEVIQVVLSELELSLQETNAQLEVGSLPSVLGDASQLGQLFQNLLSNALKFRQPNTSPRIQVRSARVLAQALPVMVHPMRLSEAYYCVEVVDNGIGFNEQYVDRIFQVFQRLHGQGAFAGTGIGLAICQKVAENHGGAIRARSQPGQGATFSVYLPE